ncbi:MAG: energy transducer TonB [Bacteroidota bacterium]
MKLKAVLLFFILNLPGLNFAQISPTDPEFEAIPIGIKEQLENTLESQLTMPKILLNTNYTEKVIVYLNIDSSGQAYHIKFDKGLNNLMRLELTKILKLMQFKRTLHINNEEAPYFIAFPLAAHHYLKYKKQKQKDIVKSKLERDSSMIVYSIADVSPLYFKNGDEGLQEYFLTELDYPKMAMEQSIEGTVILSFVVETNGYVGNIEIKKGVNGGCTDEAIALIRNTRWQPAEKAGKLVRYKVTYPITFSLVNKNKANQAQTIGQ